MVSFGRFRDFPPEIRLLIWEQHFASFFKSPRIHTFNGGFLLWRPGQSERKTCLQSITNRGRLLRNLAHRYEWHLRDVPLLHWKTVIHDLWPNSGKVYSAQGGLIALWPSLRPLINQEAFDAAKAYCRRFQVLDLWLDNTTMNICQPALVDFASDVFRLAPGVAKMMSELDGVPWLARIRRLAIGPFGLWDQFDIVSIQYILDHIQDLLEIYILLSPDVLDSKTCCCTAHLLPNEAGFSLLEADEEAKLEGMMRKFNGPFPDNSQGTSSSDCAQTLRSVVCELRRCSTARITYGYLKA
ncbi:hypothetical protein F5Y19DRAFT_466582 [Xylariaceae sp. FL1651]|nr:hypothetical protein F5Y19DRAFT_466582 [Xylariaceae sp. FL1651]